MDGGEGQSWNAGHGEGMEKEREEGGVTGRSEFRLVCGAGEH